MTENYNGLFLTFFKRSTKKYRKITRYLRETQNIQLTNISKVRVTNIIKSLELMSINKFTAEKCDQKKIAKCL